MGRVGKDKEKSSPRHVIRERLQFSKRWPRHRKNSCLFVKRVRGRKKGGNVAREKVLEIGPIIGSLSRNDLAELERTSVEYKSYTRGKKLVNFYLGRRKWFFYKV